MFRLRTIFKIISHQKNNLCNVNRSLSYRIRNVKKEDHENVMQFMKTHYYPYEAVCASYGGPTPLEEKNDRSCMDNDFGVMTVTMNEGKEEILAAGLGAFVTKETFAETDELIEECRRTNDPYLNYLLLYKKLHEDVRFWENIASGCCCQLAGGGVHIKHRRENLMQTIITTVERRVLEETDVRMMKAEVTNEMASKMVVKLGCTLIHEIAYADFKDENGEVMLKVAPPNTHLRLYIKELKK